MRWLETFAHWTWQTSLAACVLILPALLAQLVFRGPRFTPIRHLLGLLIVARLLLPLTPQSQFSIFNLFSRKAEMVPLPVSISTTPIISPTLAPTRKPHLNIVPLVWLAGAALILGRIAVQHVRLRRAINRSQRIENKMLPPRVALFALPNLSTPALFGLFRPAILIPTDLFRTASPQTLRLILLHELAHWRRFDIAINWLMIFAQALHWFNPLVWFAMRRLRAEQELLCDRDVMRQLEPGERQSYGETLLALASPTSLPISSAIPLSSSFKQMKERIAMITQFKPTAQRALLIALPVLAAVVATLTFTAAVPKPPLLIPPAATPTNAVAETDKGIALLNEQWREITAQIALTQNQVAERERKLFLQDMATPTETFLEHERDRAEESYLEIIKIQELLKRPRAEIRQVLPTAYHDEVLDRLLQEYSKTEQQLNVVLERYKEKHPEVLRLKAQLQKIDQQIDQRINGIVLGMTALVEAKAAIRKHLGDMVEKEKARDVAAREEAAPFFEAKGKLEALQKVRDSIYIRILQETVDRDLAKKK